MIKKIAVFAVFLLVAMIPLAYADENEQVENNETENEEVNETNLSNETEKEVIAASTGLGAKIRLMQLEKSITRNIIAGEAAIAALQQTNLSVNVTGLQSIIEEMKALKIQVNQASEENQTAQKFVELKHDAIELTKQFRKEFKLLIKENDLEKIRKKVHGMNESTEMKKFNGKIKDLVKQYNAQRLEKIFEELGKKNQTLIERVRNGNAGISEIRSELLSELRSLDKEQRSEAIAKLKEDVSKHAVFRQAVAQKLKAEYLAKKESRIHERIEKIQDKEARKIVEKRLEKEGIVAEGKAEARARGDKTNISAEVNVR